MSNIPVRYVNEEIQTNQMGFLKRVAGIVLSPGKVMDSLIERPRILFPLILAAVSLAGLYASRLELYKNYLRQSMEMSTKFTESLTGMKMTPELIDQSVSSGMFSGLIGAPFGSLLMLLIITAVFFGIFKIPGGKGRFKQYLSITGYSYVIITLSYIIVFAASFFTGSLHQDIPLTSLANLFDTSMRGSYFFGVLKGLDIFWIWYYAVMAIGLTKLTGFKKRTVYLMVAAVFIVGMLINAGGELAYGAMMK